MTKRRLLGVAAATLVVAMSRNASAEGPVRLYAAGSLRAALTEVAQAFTKESGVQIAATYGPSGLLRERIEKGEPADVFASANMAHPEAVHRSGRYGPVILFARNRLCALAQPGMDVTPDTLLDRMLDPDVELGTSTPKADPSGDYAWALFERAEKLRPGAFAKLDAKALQLTGGPQSPPPKDRTIYGKLMEERAADIFLTYCTNAVAARKEVPSLQIVAVPDALAVGADYGLTVAKSAGPGAGQFATYIMSPQGQSILARHGFDGGDTASR